MISILLSIDNFMSYQRVNQNSNGFFLFLSIDSIRWKGLKISIDIYLQAVSISIDRHFNLFNSLLFNSTVTFWAFWDFFFLRKYKRHFVFYNSFSILFSKLPSALSLCLLSQNLTAVQALKYQQWRQWTKSPQLVGSYMRRIISWL